MIQVELISTTEAQRETAALVKGEWATLLDAALAQGKAYRITCPSREAARGTANFLYKLLRSGRYTGRFTVHRRGNVLYVIPTA